MTASHDLTIAAAISAFEPDGRVLALWLEGSFATGTQDAASDVDLHLAVADAAFDEFTSAPEAILERIGPPLSFIRVPLPRALLLPATLAGPVRIDVFVEQRASIPGRPRPVTPRMLFDRDAVRADLEAAPVRVHDAAAKVEELLRVYWYGSMWPRRFMIREDWSNLLLNDIVVVHQFTIPAWLIADGSPEFYREWFGLARYLTPARRKLMDELHGAALEAFAGIAEGAPDRDRLARYHKRLFAVTWSALREASAATGVPYPDEVEQHFREYYRREAGIDVPLLG